ncbi:MAG: hypothetical protein V5A64_01270 [Candidatus Thermoplasmatota archaeon]
MMEQALDEGNDFSSNVRSHDEILEMIEEAKQFEERIPEFDVEPAPVEEEEEIIEETEEELAEGIERKKRENAILLKIKSFLNLKPEDLSRITKDVKPEPTVAESDKVKERKPGFLKGKLKDKIFKFFKRRQKGVEGSRPGKHILLTPTSFRVGFDENGNLVNLDLMKDEEKAKKIERNLKGIFKKEGGKSSSEGSISGKFKNVFGKLGRLKEGIPFIGKK